MTGRSFSGSAVVLALVAACGSTPPASPPVTFVPAVSAPVDSRPTTAPDPTTAPPTPSSAPVAASASVAFESAVGPIPSSVDDRAWEPVVAADPTNADRVAVVYEHRGPGAACSQSPVIRISHDGGRTWRSTKGHPGAGSGRGMGLHAAIAWGPGPRGDGRLYWANMTMAGCAGGLSLSTAYSDDEGATWSALRVERRTPPWVGGFPDLAVDANPTSPNYGAVYVGYNWLPPGASAPGFPLLASSDFGRTWHATEIPVAPRPDGYPESWRIAYRVRPAPDGSIFASWYQVDMRHWDRANIFAKGGSGNVGRLGVAVARVTFDRSSGRLSVGPSRIAVTVPETVYTTSGGSAAGTAGRIRPDPMWVHGFDVDPTTGRLLLAVARYGASTAGAPHGTIRVGRSDDDGATWTFRTLPAVAPIAGRRQSSFRPNLVASHGSVVVPFRTLDDVGTGATIGTAYAFSPDGGASWLPPVPTSQVRWRAADLGAVVNGVGLRERAERLANGDVFWAYGDGRLAAHGATGRTAVYGTRIAIHPGSGG